jgi:hypothetical protein
VGWLLEALIAEMARRQRSSASDVPMGPGAVSGQLNLDRAHVAGKAVADTG